MSNYWDTIASKNYNDGIAISETSRQMMLKLVKAGDSILDTGCGNGITYWALKEYCPDFTYHGFDYSEKMIDVARELYPEASFEVLPAGAMDKFADNSYDIVYMRHLLDCVRDYRPIVKNAFRICRKKVIIDNRRAFISDPDKIVDHNTIEGHEWYNCYTADYNLGEFNQLARELSVNVSYFFPKDKEMIETGAFVVIGKHLDDAVFDLDDFYDENNNLDLILDLKKRFPNLKVTLFCIPSKCSVDFIKGLKDKYGDWIKFVPHGWRHDTERGPRECDIWTREEAHKYLEMIEERGIFEKGFKAPGWEINRATYEALAERGYWIMEHWEYDRYLDIKLPRYTTGHLYEVHGHIQDNVPLNNLKELATTKCNFTDKTQFHFVDEVLDDNNYLDKLCQSLAVQPSLQ